MSLAFVLLLSRAQSACHRFFLKKVRSSTGSIIINCTTVLISSIWTPCLGPFLIGEHFSPLIFLICIWMYQFCIKIRRRSVTIYEFNSPEITNCQYSFTYTWGEEIPSSCVRWHPSERWHQGAKKKKERNIKLYFRTPVGEMAPGAISTM